jgi:acyl carrier protein
MNDVAPKGRIAEQVAAMWRELFPDAVVDSQADFFRLGGDSLSASVLMVHVEEVFGLQLDPIEVFERPTLADFSAFISDCLAFEGHEVMEQESF